MQSNQKKSKTLAGIAILSALVVVLDSSMKFSGFKIPFPFPGLTFLKFDFTGIPIVLSLLIYGLTPGATTSFVAFLAILARSGDIVGSSMKAIAEFSTIVGIFIGLRFRGKIGKAMSFVLGITSRCIIMSLFNVIILPLYYGMSYEYTISLIPGIVVFNVMQGALSILVGYLIYEPLIHGAPSLMKP